MMQHSDIHGTVFIQRRADLERLVRELSREPIIAVDTESNSLYAYQEQVCLVQFSTPSADYLVDPLEIVDLSPLDNIFQDTRIEKVFHAAEYDLICLRRDFGFEINYLFDTMIAASVLGRKSLGLGAILREDFGVRLDKRYQRANWGQRPLPDDLLAYAILDTHYLIPLRNRFHQALRDHNRWALAKEDFERLGEVVSNQHSLSPPEDPTYGCWRISGAYDLEPRNAAVLMELCRYRDQQARSRNLPLFKVLSNRTLLTIAEYAPRRLDEIYTLPGISKRQIKQHGQKLLEAVERGLKIGPLYPPARPRSDGQFTCRLEALRRWRKNAAQNMGVSSDVVMPRDLLFSLAENNPVDMDDMATVLEKVPWRFERFGRQISAVLRDC